METVINSINFFGIRPTFVSHVDQTLTISVTNTFDNEEIFNDIMLVYMMTEVNKVRRLYSYDITTVVIQSTSETTYDLFALPEYLHYTMSRRHWINGNLYDQRYTYMAVDTYTDYDVCKKCNNILTVLGAKTHGDDHRSQTACTLGFIPNTIPGVFEYSMVEDRILTIFGTDFDFTMTLSNLEDHVVHCVRAAAYLNGITLTKIHCMCYNPYSKTVMQDFVYDLTGIIPNPPESLLPKLQEKVPELYPPS